MDKITKYLRQRKIDRAEERFRKFNSYYQGKGWIYMAVEDLDNIPATIHGKAEGNLETAARILNLTHAYWEQYQEHYGSEGASRGQDLNQKCYDLLCEKLGLWSEWTLVSLKSLCRWNIGSTERTMIVDRIIAWIKEMNKISNASLVEDVILCCFRNDDHSDSVKALVHLYALYEERDSLSPMTLNHRDSWPRFLFNLHLARQEWEAETVVTKYLALTTNFSLRNGAKICAYQGEVQIKQGQLVHGEATLQKGMESKDKCGGHFSCCEQLLSFYLQQERWNDAERVGLYLIEKNISRSRSYHSKATQKATRVIRMNRWRTFDWIDAQVYNLHELYNNKRQLAMAYVNLKRYNEAQKLLEELMENKMHTENPILVASKELLVTVYIESGKFDEAEKIQEKIIEEITEKFGYDSDKLIPELERLADIYQKNNHLGKRHHVKLRLLRYR
ncbi:hypothetical protein CPB83DRAFT_909796 [Crepidotus variabilis]|uniref:Uncharacterized protein n=1 Tax=Crepidotus variabilis TaxID=179855 RepID=A0A9P6E8V7_9AGAR|nr:hypothetical protein CPB83DRAFT_909796 [Crepidotus variabilis]